ncbi:MAG: hypothetical protein V1911_02985 [Candidatus Micrarchaeota archaeon]
MGGSAGGQASVEFMMTYGWAMIIAAAVVVVLIGYGVFDLSSIAGEHIPDGTAFTIADHKLNTTSLTLVLGNIGGEKVQINQIAVTGDAAGTYLTKFNLTASGQSSPVEITVTGLNSSALYKTKDITVSVSYDNLQTGLSNNVDTMKTKMKVQ